MTSIDKLRIGRPVPGDARQAGRRAARGHYRSVSRSNSAAAYWLDGPGVDPVTPTVFTGRFDSFHEVLPQNTC